MKRDDKVLVTAYVPPIEARVVDTYIVPIRNIYEKVLIDKYPDGVPMVEVIIESSGKLETYVQDVVKKV